MKRKVILGLILLLLPTTSWSDEHVLVMSKEDNVCQHMLKLYNEDMKQYGEVRYKKHKEFNWLKWKKKTISFRPASTPQVVEDMQARIAFFDINNDLKDEVVIYRESMLSSNLIDVYDIFLYENLSMFNDVVDGSRYYAKTLKSFDSEQGVPLNVYDLNEEDIEKLPERIRFFLDATKKRGDKNLYFVGWSKKINFFKINYRFFVLFEGPRTIGPDEQFDKVEKYSIISELQKDNTLNNKCLYLIKEDNPSKRRTK